MRGGLLEREWKQATVSDKREGGVNNGMQGNRGEGQNNKVVLKIYLCALVDSMRVNCNFELEFFLKLCWL